MKDTFRFVETKQTTGIVEKLDKMALDEDRSLNNYVGQILKKHIEEKEDTKD